jgi:hypothetical protein
MARLNGSFKWLVKTTCGPRATLLAHHVIVEDQTVIPWYKQDVQVQSQSFVVNAICCPCIGVSQQTSQEVLNFLYEQGYPFAQSSQAEALESPFLRFGCWKCFCLNRDCCNQLESQPLFLKCHAFSTALNIA